MFWGFDLSGFGWVFVLVFFGGGRGLVFVVLFVYLFVGLVWFFSVWFGFECFLGGRLVVSFCCCCCQKERYMKKQKAG